MLCLSLFLCRPLLLHGMALELDLGVQALSKVAGPPLPPPSHPAVACPRCCRECPWSWTWGCRC